MEKYINRLLEKSILKTSKIFPVVLICGPRQVGKTTILEKIKKDNKLEMNYITLDDPIERKLAKEDPSLFLEKYSTPLVIDEIQYATELLPYMKMIVDKKRIEALEKNEPEPNGLYFLTGSQMFSMMRNVSESLAGRVGIIDMYGLSYSELINEQQDYFLPTFDRCKKREKNKRPDINEVFKMIINGSFPKIYQTEEDVAELFFRGYLRTYLERDIRDIINIKDETKFLTFISALAARTGQELNYNNLSADVGIDNKTAEKWLSILKTSGIVFLLQPYSNNPTKRVIKTSKLYFTDTGLACFLSGYSDSKTLERSAINGAIFENYVIMEIVKSYVNNNMDPRLYLSYYRDSNQKEIDLIININNTVYPIEIKKTKNPDKSMIKNFTVLQKDNVQIGEGGIICMTEKLIPIDKNNNAIPIQCI